MKVPIKLTLDIDYDIGAGFEDDDTLQFYLEENHCVENIIRQLYEKLEDGFCHTCSHATVKIQDRPLHDDEEKR